MPCVVAGSCVLELLLVLGLSGLYYVFTGTVYTAAGHCAKLNASRLLMKICLCPLDVQLTY